MSKIIYISVACVVGPSVNTLKTQLIFSFQTQFMQFVWISSKQNPLKNIYIFHMLALKFVK
jgi:hypothetical protein